LLAPRARPDNSGRLVIADHMARYVALIPAAGTGSRMESERPKQYLPVLGRPLLGWAIEALASHRRVEAVYLVLAPQDPWFERFDWPSAGKRLTAFRVGGETRAQSVVNGLQALAGEIAADDWLLVHDAARPCLSAALLDRLIEAVGGDAVGGLLAIRVADTLKRADADSRSLSTEPRDGLWQAQTPQMFRRALLQRALAAVNPLSATDEASAVERLGMKPLLVESSAENIKVTVPEDLKLAEAILRSR
jgi:2-C-methyl-D-erythritol 4-phosphate cytidylyltransferase